MTEAFEDDSPEGIAGGLEVQRDELGRLLPGSTANPDGRAKGSLNSTTKLARELIRAHAEQAARGIMAMTRSESPFIRLAACKLVMEWSRDTDEAQDAGEEWQDHMSLEDAETILEIRQRTLDRMGHMVIDVTPEPDLPPVVHPDPALAEATSKGMIAANQARDQFKLDTLPAPPDVLVIRVDK